MIAETKKISLICYTIGLFLITSGLGLSGLSFLVGRHIAQVGRNGFTDTLIPCLAIVSVGVGLLFRKTWAIALSILIFVVACVHFMIQGYNPRSFSSSLTGALWGASLFLPALLLLWCARKLGVPGRLRMSKGRPG